jgi:hypothetical protein
MALNPFTFVMVIKPGCILFNVLPMIHPVGKTYQPGVPRLTCSGGLGSFIENSSPQNMYIAL